LTPTTDSFETYPMALQTLRHYIRDNCTKSSWPRFDAKELLPYLLLPFIDTVVAKFPDFLYYDDLSDSGDNEIATGSTLNRGLRKYYGTSPVVSLNFLKISVIKYNFFSEFLRIPKALKELRYEVNFKNLFNGKDFGRAITPHRAR
jgi:hypothetical protein